MSVNSDIVNKYSDPLPCRNCKYALEPVGGYSRCESAFCKKYDSADNMKPYGVLFANQECDFYKPEDPELPEDEEIDEDDELNEDEEEESASEYLERVYGLRFDADEGRWVTTEKDHKIHINGEGVPDKGNPFVIAVMKGQDPRTVKSGRSTAESSVGVGKRTPEQTKALRTKASSAYTKYRNACVSATKTLDDYRYAQRYLEHLKELEKRAENDTHDYEAKVERGEEKLRNLLGDGNDSLDLNQLYSKTAKIQDSLADANQKLKELDGMVEKGLISKKEPQYKTALKKKEKYEAELDKMREIFAAYSDLDTDKEKLARFQNALNYAREQIGTEEENEKRLRPEAEKAKQQRQRAKEARDRAVLELLPSPEHCESAEDVHDYLVAKGYFSSSDESNRPDGIDDNIILRENEISVQNAVDVAKRLDAVFEDYPKIKGIVTGIQTVRQSDGTYAYVGKSPETMSLSLCDAYYASDRLAKEYSENVADDFHPRGTDHTSIIDHEMTHLIEGALERVYQGDGHPADEVMRRVMTRIDGEYNPRREKEYRTMVSGYAVENPGTLNTKTAKEYGRNTEWLAEAMAEARCSKEPRELSKVVREEFEGLLREYDLM